MPIYGPRVSLHPSDAAALSYNGASVHATSSPHTITVPTGHIALISFIATNAGTTTVTIGGVKVFDLDHAAPLILPFQGFLGGAVPGNVVVTFTGKLNLIYAIVKP